MIEFFLTMNRANPYKQQCRNTNMISMAIFFINNEVYLNEIQGRRYIWYRKDLSDYIINRKQKGGKLTKKYKNKSKKNKSIKN